jgi:hypothetical protein
MDDFRMLGIRVEDSERSVEHRGELVLWKALQVMGFQAEKN